MRRVDAFLFGPETRDRLLVTHLALAALVMVRIAAGPYLALAGQPPALFRPVWFLRALPGMPPAAVIVALQVVGTAAGALAFPAPARYRRVAFAVAWACLLVLGGLRGSQGKVLHNDVLLLLACVPFLAAPAVTRHDEPAPSPRYGWPVRTALVVVAGAYFFSGLHKLMASGLAWVTTDNLRFILLSGARSGRPMFPGVGRLLARSGPLDHVLAAGVLGLELSFPVVLFRPRLRPLYAAGAAALHAGIWFALGLDYWAWMGVAAAVLVDWSPAVALVTTGGTPRRRRRGSRAGGRAGAPARRAWAGTPGGPDFA